ncbi:ABC transporter substrate-binding protein, partial [Acidobacteria bacterium AH-259-D05]|nr:ABC transporter substrate-binding protein [Acidobacteria bacterium AH-259-D05]
MTRIVSLIASATEIVHALGMGSHQVGRSHECDFPNSIGSLPVCTAPKFPVTGNSRETDGKVKETLRKAVSVYDVFEEVLEELQPTHIITQSQCEVCAVSLKDVEQAVATCVSSKPKIVSLEPYTLEDVWSDIHLVADSLGIQTKGCELVQELKQRTHLIAERVGNVRERPRVACIEWLEPLMAAGNWVPELVEMAGGRNLLSVGGVHSDYISWKQLVESDPDILVLMPCGFDMKRTEAEIYWLTDHPDWNSVRAVRNHRVYITNGNH